METFYKRLHLCDQKDTISNIVYLLSSVLPNCLFMFKRKPEYLIHFVCRLNQLLDFLPHTPESTLVKYLLSEKHKFSQLQDQFSQFTIKEFDILPGFRLSNHKSHKCCCFDSCIFSAVGICSSSPQPELYIFSPDKQAKKCCHVCTTCFSDLIMRSFEQMSHSNHGITPNLKQRAFYFPLPLHIQPLIAPVCCNCYVLSIITSTQTVVCDKNTVFLIYYPAILMKKIHILCSPCYDCLDVQCFFTESYCNNCNTASL